MTGDLEAAIAAAESPKSCARCGRTFGSQAAYTLAHDGRCLPDHFLSQLVQVDGVWVTRAAQISDQLTAPIATLDP